MDIERGKIAADYVHHHGNRLRAYDRQPFRLFHNTELGSVLGGKLNTNRFEIVTGIKPVGDSADVLAERLAITEKRRTGEHIDLCTRVVDVIFARDVIAGKGEKIGERVSKHRTAPVTDMHWTCRIGGNVFDVD